MPLTAEDLLPVLEPYLNARRWFVAYSGGVDSHVLLHCLARLRSLMPAMPSLTAVHVNHQLQIDSGLWAQHCASVCRQLSISLEVFAVDVAEGDGLEEAARRQRYAVFEQLLSRDDVLLQGHHLDDQVETLLLRLIRGSGTSGLAAMPASRALGTGRLLRPLLAFSRRELLEYAQSQQLDWVEDPSNHSDQFERNYLRNSVLPLIASRWPHYRETVQRAANLSLESKRLAAEIASEDFASISVRSGISLKALKRLSAARQRNVVRYWISQRDLPTPSAVHLAQLFNEVIAAREDASPRLQWRGARIGRFGDLLFAFAPLPAIDCRQIAAWHPPRNMELAGAGTLLSEEVMGAGLSTSVTAIGPISIRFRQGGERCRPGGRGHSQTLKKLLQEYRVPPWLRDRVPLIYAGEQLVAVADYWICAGFEATGSEPGWRLVWRPPADR